MDGRRWVAAAPQVAAWERPEFNRHMQELALAPREEDRDEIFADLAEAEREREEVEREEGPEGPPDPGTSSEGTGSEGPR